VDTGNSPDVMRRKHRNERSTDPVGLVLATRVPGEELSGLPELGVEGLTAGDARALLDSVLTGALDVRVRDQMVADRPGG
jgi:hypothetical protein